MTEAELLQTAARLGESAVRDLDHERVARIVLERLASEPVRRVRPLHELDDLTASELEVLLETLPPSADAAAHPDPASLDELDAQSLERLLRSLEG